MARSAVGLPRLAQFFVGHADPRAFTHLGKLHAARLNFCAVHIETAGDDHVFLAIDDVIEPIVIPVADVTRVMPAMSSNFRRRFRQVVITSAYQGATRHDFADLERRKEFAVVIYNRQPHRPRRFAAASQSFWMITRGRRRQRPPPEKRHVHTPFRLPGGIAPPRPDTFY